MTTFKLDNIMGFSRSHIDQKLNIHLDVISPFLALQKSAKKAGFELEIASGFRDFSRQRLIWQEKFNGKRPVLDKDSKPLEIKNLNKADLLWAILRWSALPGASRHHWGTDIDIYASNLLSNFEKLKLEPSEYAKGGHQYEFYLWLEQNMGDFDFYQPFNNENFGVAIEPWHLSFKPIASIANLRLTAQSYIENLDFKINDNPQLELAARDIITANIDTIFKNYITI